MGEVLYDPELSGKAPVYRDREHAGRVLAEFMARHNLVPDFVLAIPAGGVPVALEVAKKFMVPMDLIIVKKVLYPWTTEAGFGAVGPFGIVRLGPAPLSEEEIEEQVEKAMQKVEARERLLRGGRPYPDLTGKKVVVVDDGIAAGYTMMVAVEAARRMGAEEVWAAAPTASVDGAKRVAQVADLVIVPNLRGGPVFAVADAYEIWYDLSEEDVLEYLEEAKRLGLLAV